MNSQRSYNVFVKKHVTNKKTKNYFNKIVNYYFIRGFANTRSSFSDFILSLRLLRSLLLCRGNAVSTFLIFESDNSPKKRVFNERN